jgi:hypothetical protein
MQIAIAGHRDLPEPTMNLVKTAIRQWLADHPEQHPQRRLCGVDDLRQGPGRRRRISRGLNAEAASRRLAHERALRHRRREACGRSAPAGGICRKV